MLFYSYNLNMKKLAKKNTYVERAIQVLKREGLRLSLDEVAIKMGITKKTIYNHFSSKNELLDKCIYSITDDFKTIMEQMNDENTNAVEGLTHAFAQLGDFMNVLSPMFFCDLGRLNPDLAHSEHILGSGLFQQKIAQNILKGIEEGLYRPDINADFFSHYFAHAIFGFYIKNVIMGSDIGGRENYFRTIIQFNLSGLVSEKGRGFLNK